MNNKPQLYIKNDKGRYVPYNPPKPVVDDRTLYKKIGKKYVPFAARYDGDWLNEGVFVVRSDKFGNMRNYGDSEYLQRCFRIDKVSNNYRITADQLASLEDYTDFCIRELDKIENERNRNYGLSTIERIQYIIGSVFKFSAILKEKIKEEGTQKRSGEDYSPAF